jgi:hypothetical protein
MILKVPLLAGEYFILLSANIFARFYIHLRLNFVAAVWVSYVIIIN